MRSAPEYVRVAVDSVSPTENKTHLVAKMRGLSCPRTTADKVSSVLLEIPFKSLWGNNIPAFQIDMTDQRAYALIGDTKLFMPLSDKESALALTTAACDLDLMHDPMTRPTPVVVAFIKGLLDNLSTDCSFRLADDGTGWLCEMESTPTDEVAKNLDAVGERMVKKWQRQPYLLVRKIAIGTELAVILRSGKLDGTMPNFCLIAGYSLPEELPIVLQSKALRERLCESKGDLLQQRASWILSEINKEIEALVSKFEEQSPLGTLVVKLPHGLSALRVHLQLDSPDQSTPSAAVFGTFDTKPGIDLCWHDFYDVDSAVLAGAIEMGVLGQGQNHCMRLYTEAFKAALANARNHIVYSVASEMEFPITNHRAILLRLPEGEYTYTVTASPPNLSELDMTDAAQLASGKIAWQGRHPIVVIH